MSEAITSGFDARIFRQRFEADDLYCCWGCRNPSAARSWQPSADGRSVTCPRCGAVHSDAEHNDLTAIYPHPQPRTAELFADHAGTACEGHRTCLIKAFVAGVTSGWRTDSPDVKGEPSEILISCDDSRDVSAAYRDADGAITSIATAMPVVARHVIAWMEFPRPPGRIEMRRVALGGGTGLAYVCYDCGAIVPDAAEFHECPVRGRVWVRR